MLEILWFILIAVLFTGFFFLEGFDYGVGTLLPFLGKSDSEKRVIINSIGPFWDGNEVWLLTAGGAMFASFPHWYATLFSGLYLPLVLMLVFLIYRGVSFEFRHLEEGDRWKKIWDTGIFIGSMGPALLWGVTFANLIKGMPIDETMTYTGGFFNLLNPFALIGGILTVLFFAFHGALFLNLRLKDDLLSKAVSMVSTLWIPVIAIAVIYLIYGIAANWINITGLDGISALLMLLFIVLAGLMHKKGKSVLAFTFSGLSIVFYTALHFAALFPNVMISTTHPDFNITISEAASSAMTLKIMTIVAVIFVPIVIVYQIWTYRIFRKRLSVDDDLKY